MSRRIEIELTSARPDGSWTWRVAGAKQPKGVLDGALLPEGAKVGDVMRADAEIELEGTVVTAVLAQPTKRAPDLLQLITDSGPFEAVTTTLVSKGPRSRDREDRGPRPDRPDRPRSDRPSGARSDRPAGPRPDRSAGARPDRPVGARSDRGDARPADGAGSQRAERPARPDRPPRPERSAGADRPGRPRPGDASRREGVQRPAAADAGRASRARRLNPASVYRNAVLDSLAPEERAVAEQLLHGGVPAVRRALQEQNAKVRAEGGLEIKADALVALAEELLPRLKAAEWRDRAEAAVKAADELHIRDLRSVVAGADAGARDDESRILAKTLREALDGRETAEREAWLGEVTTCLDEGRVAKALRMAGRPPDPRTRFPVELTNRLTEMASAAMSPDTPVDRWAQLLAALLESPVRRAVKPVGLPAEPGEALLAAARQASGRIPALAPMLGLRMPPPPGPHRPGVGRPRPPQPPARAEARPVAVEQPSVVAVEQPSVVAVEQPSVVAVEQPSVVAVEEPSAVAEAVEAVPVVAEAEAVEAPVEDALVESPEADQSSPHQPDPDVSVYTAEQPSGTGPGL